MNVPTSSAIINTNTEPQKQINNNESKPWLFQPGQSGNPKGRPPKGHSITEMFQNMLGNSPKKKQLFAERIFNAAIAGDMIAARMIWNYMDGMPKQKLEATGKDGQPLFPIPLGGVNEKYERMVKDENT